MKEMLNYLILASSFLGGIMFSSLDSSPNSSMISSRESNFSSPPCIQIFKSIEKYSEIYDIPKKYVYGIAYYETRYQGPFHWAYNPKQTSYAGALGPMQIMYSTAKGLFPEKEFSREFLLQDIDFNVHCSMKLLRRLYDKHKDWKLVFGAYNTGKPLVNSYAENVYNFQ